MATRSPLTDLTDYERRLTVACWPIPMTIFRALKSIFYSGIALAGMWIVLEAGVGETTTLGVFTGFMVFLIIYATETREFEIASSLASVTLTFFTPDGSAPEDTDSDSDDRENGR